MQILAYFDKKVSRVAEAVQPGNLLGYILHQATNSDTLVHGANACTHVLGIVSYDLIDTRSSMY